MKRIIVFLSALVISSASFASNLATYHDIERAVLDYIESQHSTAPEIMARGIDKALVKRTYWKSKEGNEFLMETDFDAMIKLAKNYNKNGDKFPNEPKVEISYYPQSG